VARKNQLTLLNTLMKQLRITSST